MRFFEFLYNSLVATFSFKLRAFFTILSVSLGIAAITIIVAATEGAYQEANKIVAKFGPDAVMLISGAEEERALGSREKTLTLDDMQAITDAFPTAYFIVPTSSSDATLSHKNKKYSSRIIGVGENYTDAWNWPVAEGDDITEEDVKASKNIALIGQYTSEKLFGSQDALGKFMLINAIPFKVVGILSERGVSPRGTNLDDRVVIPITTLMKKFLNEKQYVSSIRVRFTDQEQLTVRTEELKAFLRERKKLQPDQPDNFRALSPTEIIKFLVALTGSLVFFLGATGLITLIISGFVLANLFLLSISERKREIGIRRAVGAQKTDIILQFLFEAIALTFCGGICGFLIAFSGSGLLTYIAQFPIVFSPKAFIISLLLSITVGIIFGLQPAIRASEINPIEAIK